jgi:hypothetical protein
MNDRLITAAGLQQSRSYQDNEALIRLRLKDLGVQHTMVHLALSWDLPLVETLMYLVEGLLDQNEALREQLITLMREYEKQR